MQNRTLSALSSYIHHNLVKTNLYFSAFFLYLFLKCINVIDKSKLLYGS